jgi:hypothetical protein
VLDEVPDWIDALEREEQQFGGDQESAIEHGNPDESLQ